MIQRLGLLTGSGQGEGQGLVVRGIEEPAAIGLAFGFDEMDGFAHARIGGDTGGAEVVEGAEDVVVVARGPGELEEFGVGDCAGGEAAKEGAFHEVVFGAAASGGGSDGELGI